MVSSKIYLLTFQRTIFCLSHFDIFKKPKFLKKFHLMNCILYKRVQISNTNLFNLNFSEIWVLSF